MDHASWYRLCLLLSILLGAGFFLLGSGRRLPLGKRLAALACAALSGLALARLFYFAARAGFLVPMYGWGHLLSLWPEGLAMAGAVMGLLLGGALSARPLKLDRQALLDQLAPAGLLALALGRLAEFFTDIGQGRYVESSPLQFFPFMVHNEYGEWFWAVFMLEALCALLILLRVLRMGREPAGQRWQEGLLLLMLSQILCESMRAESLKWGFVRVQQLAAALGLAAMMACSLKKAWPKAVKPLRLLVYPAILLAGTGLLIGIEFALDRWLETPHYQLYLAMAAVLVMLYLCFRHLRRRLQT